MISFDLDFYPRVFPRDEDERFALSDAIETFLSALIRNGNIIGEHVILELSDCYRVRVLCWSPDALDEANFSSYARDDLAKLRPLLARDAEFHRVPEVEREPTWCDCENPSGRILFTTFLSRLGSPVRCLYCRRDVPIYRLPLPKEAIERAELLSWQDDYQTLDTLYMNSGVGERFSYRQLARPKSDFMKRTRELAADVESSSGVPTYWLNRLVTGFPHWERGHSCPHRISARFARGKAASRPCGQECPRSQWGNPVTNRFNHYSFLMHAY